MTTVSPERRDSSLTPPVPLIDMQKSTITTYKLPNPSANETTIIPLSAERALITQQRLFTYFNQSSPDTHADTLETTPERRVMEHVARAFVEQVTGHQTVGHTYWRNKQPDSRESGGHSPVYGINYIGVYDYGSDDINYMAQMSTLVHEFGHSTADTRTTVTAFRFKDGAGQIGHTLLSHLGMSVIKTETQNQRQGVRENGDLFEEAFAEETAARWRDQFSPIVAANPDEHWIAGGNISLPVRFFDYNYTSEDPNYITTVNYSACPAYALSLLSEKSGVDLYELMCQARQPEHEAEAKRAFIQAINSVKPGLYKELRELQYTKEDFQKGLAIVRDIVNAPEPTAGE